MNLHECDTMIKSTILRRVWRLANYFDSVG
jgi:hypothetical protein